MDKTEQLYESVRSDKFESVYANSARMSVSTWDFVITFGVISTRPAETVKIEERLEVVMSPQHAKALLAILANNVREYENKLGEINLQMKTVPAAETSRFN